jgi:hypothetical protein
VPIVGNAAEVIVVDPLVTRPLASVTTETYEPAVPIDFNTTLPPEDIVASPPIVTPVAVLPALPIHMLATVSDGNAVEEIVVDPLVTRPFASVTTETYEPAVPTLLNTKLPDEDIVASPPIVTPA